MSSVDQGDTVEYVHEQLAALIAKGRGRERLWVDVVGRDEPDELILRAATAGKGGGRSGDRGELDESSAVHQ